MAELKFKTIGEHESRRLLEKYVAGQTVPNAVIAPVSPSGEVCFFSKAPVHLLADVNGWFAN